MEITIKNKISRQLNDGLIWVLVVCMFTSFVYAGIASADTDPMDILESSLLTDLEDVNIADIRLDKLSSVQGQKELISNIVANLAADTGNDAKSSDLGTAVGSASAAIRQLWHAGISIIKNDESDTNRNEIQELIEQINSVEFKLSRQVSPAIVVEPSEQIESKESLPRRDLLQKTKYENTAVIPQKLPDNEQQRESLPQSRQITKETIELFEQASQQPQHIKSPLELADILFRGGQLKESLKCYREVLNQISADPNSNSEDKAWVLFQIGNCLQKYDPSAAVQMYKQLIMEYPDSLWTDLAKVKTNLIDWSMSDRPDVLLEQYKSSSF